MPKYSNKEFAEACGVKTNYLSIYLKRGEVIVGEDGLIDTDNELNMLFMGRRIEKAAQKAAEMPEKPEKTPQKAVAQPKQPGNLRLLQHDHDHKKNLAVKTEMEAEIARLKIEKLTGRLVPVQPVSQLMRELSINMATGFKRVFDEIVEIYGSSYGLSSEQIKVMQRYAVDKINMAMTDAVEKTRKGVHKLVDEYSESRGRGERA